jgi:hypothetical protein
VAGLEVSRAVVLIGCLAAAGAIAAYTRYSQEVEQTPLFTVHVPQRPSDQAMPPATAAPPSAAGGLTAQDQTSLTRELQRELRRVGCYSGEINGLWTTSSRMAMKSFTDHVNAALPIETPDHILLSLVRAHQDRACGTPCASGQSADESGRCISDAVSAKVPSEQAQPEIKIEPAVEKAAPVSGSALPAAAAASALAVSAAVPRTASHADTPDKHSHPVAATPDETAAKSTRSERSARHGEPLPSERVNERRSRRHSSRSRPPKLVRDVLRAFGIR